MSHADHFPDAELNRENLRSLYHGLFEKMTAQKPELDRFADDRAEGLARALCMSVLEPDHPAIPTLKSGLKKFIFCFTEAEDFSASPTDEDLGTLLLDFYEETGGDLQVTANALDEYANYIPYYSQEAQASASDHWVQMSASERLQFVQIFAQERMQEDFQ